MECYTSKVKLLGLLGLTCVMVSLSYFCTTLPGLTPPVVGWIGVGFFGLGFIAFTVMFFRAGPQVVINDEGIEDRRHRIGIIRWEDIRSLSIGSVNSAKFLCVEVTDPGRYVSRLPRWGRSLTAASEALGFPALTIGFSGLSPGLKEVWAYLQARDSRRCALEPRAPLLPESRFVVRLSDSEVICERPMKATVHAFLGGMMKGIMHAFRNGPWWLLALKLAALLSFCGGPLAVTDWLKLHIDRNLAFAIGLFPSVALIFGVYSLRSDPPDRWDDCMVLFGCIGAVTLVAMNIFGLQQLMVEPDRADGGLIKLGIAIGTLFVGYYAYASYRFFRLRRLAA